MADAKTKLRELADALSSVRSRTVETRDALQELSGLLTVLAERTPALEENKLKGYKNQLAETKDILQGVQTSLSTLAKEGDVFTQLGRMVREYISAIEVANQKQAELFKPLAPEGKKAFTTLGSEFDLAKITSAIRDINDELDKSNLKALRFKQTIDKINLLATPLVGKDVLAMSAGAGPPSTAGAHAPASAIARMLPGEERALEELEKLDLATQAWEAHTRALGIDSAALETLYVTYKKVLAEAQKFAEARREWTRQPTVEEYQGRLHKEVLRPDPTKRDFMKVPKELFKDIEGMKEDVLEVGLGTSDVEERFKAAAIHSGVLALNVKTVKEAVQEIPQQMQEELIIKAPTLHEMDVSQIEKTTVAEEVAIVTKEKAVQAIDTKTKAIEKEISAEEKLAGIQRSAKITQETGYFAKLVADPKDLDAAIARYREVEEALKKISVAMTELTQRPMKEGIVLQAKVVGSAEQIEEEEYRRMAERAQQREAERLDPSKIQQAIQATQGQTAAIQEQVAPTKELIQVKDELTAAQERLIERKQEESQTPLTEAEIQHWKNLVQVIHDVTRAKAEVGQASTASLEEVEAALDKQRPAEMATVDETESFRRLKEAVESVVSQKGKLVEVDAAAKPVTPVITEETESFRRLREAVEETVAAKAADIEYIQQALLQVSVDKQKTQAVKELTQARRDLLSTQLFGGGPGGGKDVSGDGGVTDIPTRDIPTQLIGTHKEIAAALAHQGDMYEIVNRALKTFIAENEFADQSTTKFKTQIDMFNRVVRVSALVLDEWGKEGEQNIYKVKAALDGLTVSFTGQIINKQQQFTEGFAKWKQHTGDATKSVNNLKMAAEHMGATLDDVTPGQINYNEGLVRFGVVTRNAFGQLQRGTIVMDRFGNVAQTVKSKYETFADAIGKSINKVIRWGIAVGVVYGTMRMFRKGMSDMIEMQSSLSDVAVITGDSMDKVGDSLETVAIAAERTGISLVEALSVYEKALRATGEYTDETQRAAAANELLSQALVFSRLGSIDVTKAIDTLVGALRQSGMEISQADDLLDKWVATTKTAYVSLEDLGEGFAITAAQAQSVGVSIDQLNGIIATVAKTTTLSSTEIGNFTRTMLAALESDQAVDVLRQHGVAIKNLKGEYRDWGDVIQDISDLFRAGAISEKELSKIGIALGGGRRRGPQFIAFLKEYSEVSRVAAMSAAAEGDAVEALDIKMEDLRNTVNGLQVAISQMVAAAGLEGGLLELMTSLVKVVTQLTGLLTGLTRMFGTSTAKLIAFTVAFATLKKLSVGARLGSMLGMGAAGMGGQMPMPGMGQDPGRLGKLWATSAGKGLQRVMPYAGAALGMGALEYMTSGSIARTAGSMLGAGIGSAAGAALGTFGGPIGTLIGATIGAAIGEQVEGALKQAESKRVYERKLERGDKITYEEVLIRLTDAVEDMRDFVEERRGQGPSIGGERPIPVWEARTPEELLESAKLFIDKLTEELPDPSATSAVAWGERERISREIATIQQLINAMNELKPAVEENTEALKKEIPPFARERAEIGRRVEPGVGKALEAEQLEQLLRFSRGEIPRAAVTRQAAVSEKLPNILTIMIHDLGSNFEEAFGRGQAAVEELAVEMSHLDPTAIEMLGKRLEGLTELQRELSGFDDIINATNIELQRRMDIEKQFLTDQENYITLLNGLIDEMNRAMQPTIPTGFMRLPEELSSEQIDAAIADARKMQDEFAKSVGVAPKLLRDQAKEIATLYDKEFDEILGLSQNFLDYMLQQYMEAQEKLEESFSMRRLKDVSPEKFGEIQARNRYWVEFLARIKGMTTPEYLEEEGYTENLIMGPNNVWQKILTTSEAMSFTLQDILETEKKQLEGMWNIPSGATFWVPLTSLFYQQQAGAGGVPELPPLEDLQKPSGGLAFLEDEDIPKAKDEEDAGELMSRREAMGLRRRKEREDRLKSAAASRGEATEAIVQVVTQMRSIADKLDMDPEKYASIIYNAIKDTTPEDSALGAQERLYDKAFRNLENVFGIEMPSFTESLYDQVLEGLNLEDILGPDYDRSEAMLLLETAAGELSEAANKLTPRGDADAWGTGSQDLLVTLQGTLGQMAEFIAAPLDMDIKVDVVSDKTIQLIQTILLDGTFIKRFISEALARETGSTAKASGYSETIQ